MSKKTNALDRFRKYWKSLDYEESRDMWAILTAFRGPDNAELSQSVKQTTIARIRGVVFDDPLPIPIDWNETPLSPDERETINFKKRKAQGNDLLHFWYHYSQACRALKNFGEIDLYAEGVEEKKTKGGNQ